MFKHAVAATGLVMAFLLALTALADTVTLKNGTVIEGTVIKFGDKYRVKTSDGQTKIIPESEVASVIKSTPGVSGAMAVPAVPGAPSPESGVAAGPVAKAATAAFAAAKARADTVDAPILAVTIWEKFIDSNPTPPDLDAAKAELEKWKKLQKDNAERINGKWVGGDERKKLLKEVDRLCKEANEQLDNQTLQAIEKYEKALKLYPNSFEANFAMGYYSIKKGAYGSTGRGNNAEIDKAVKSLEAAVRLRPNSPEALSNLAIGYAFKQRWEDSVLMAYKAVKIEDNQALAENFVNLLVEAPQGMKSSNKKIKPVIEEAVIIAQKYGIPPTGSHKFHYLSPKPPGADKKAPDGQEEGQAGIIGNGSGFLISEDGYIITNRHVVNEKNRLFRVRFDDGEEKSAEVIAIDTKCDIALIKIKTDSPLPYLRIAEADEPNPAAKCMVLGYPVADMLDFKMQVTTGEITSINDLDDYHVTLTANTTHGNSGGPIIDRDGNVIGVLSAGMTAYAATYIKALSAGQIHGFLDRCRDKYTATFEPGKATDTPFDGEKLAKQARKATLLILIIRGDGKETMSDIASAKIPDKPDAGQGPREKDADDKSSDPK